MTVESTTERVLRVLALLQSRPSWTADELAAELGVTDRSVRRDVDRLRALGYPVRATPGVGGGYQLGAGTRLPPLLLHDDEAIATAVSLRLASGSTIAGAAEAALRALAKLDQVMPPRLRAEVRAIYGATETVVGAGTEIDADTLLALARACRDATRVRFRYTTRQEADDERTVEPVRMVAAGQRWYLMAWDVDRDDWRTFRLDRMTPRTPTGPRFAAREVPGGDVGAFVAARFTGAVAGPVPPAGSTTAGSTATGSTAHRASGTAATSSSPGAWEAPATRWPCEGWVELAAPARVVAPFVEDGAVEAAGPERCRVRLGSWSWVALAARVAAFDADLLAAGPAELVAACDAVARRLGAVAAS